MYSEGNERDLKHASTNCCKLKIIFLQYLSVHSPAFEALFFGDFAEKGKEEVEIKDVVYEVTALE